MRMHWNPHQVLLPMSSTVGVSYRSWNPLLWSWTHTPWPRKMKEILGKASSCRPSCCLVSVRGGSRQATVCMSCKMLLLPLCPLKLTESLSCCTLTGNIGKETLGNIVWLSQLDNYKQPLSVWRREWFFSFLVCMHIPFLSVDRASPPPHTDIWDQVIPCQGWGELSCAL